MSPGGITRRKETIWQDVDHLEQTGRIVVSTSIKGVPVIGKIHRFGRAVIRALAPLSNGTRILSIAVILTALLGSNLLPWFSAKALAYGPPYDSVQQPTGTLPVTYGQEYVLRATGKLYLFSVPHDPAPAVYGASGNVGCRGIIPSIYGGFLTDGYGGPFQPDDRLLQVPWCTGIPGSPVYSGYNGGSLSPATVQSWCIDGDCSSWRFTQFTDSCNLYGVSVQPGNWLRLSIPSGFSINYNQTMWAYGPTSLWVHDGLVHQVSCGGPPQQPVTYNPGSYLAPATVQSWCVRGDCSGWRFTQLVEDSGCTNLYGVKVQSGNWLELNIPSGFSIDYDGVRINGPTDNWVQAASVRVIGTTCGSNATTPPPPAPVYTAPMPTLDPNAYLTPATVQTWCVSGCNASFTQLVESTDCTNMYGVKVQGNGSTVTLNIPQGASVDYDSIFGAPGPIPNLPVQAASIRVIGKTTC